MSAETDRPRVAILSLGDMGGGIARVLSDKGFDLSTVLAGRSGETRQRAQDIGVTDAGDLDALVQEADVILSILPPASAAAQARAVSQAVRRTGAAPTYVDCNAIAPATMAEVAGCFAETGVRVLDAGIIGLAPDRATTRFYVSGPGAETLNGLSTDSLLIKPLGEEIGRASAMKMAYASLTKGTAALHLACILMAHEAGLFEEIAAEFASSQSWAWERIKSAAPLLAADAGRWSGEMHEIAKSFESLGLPGGFHEAAAALFETLDRTPLGRETRQTRDPNRTLEQVLPIYAAALKPQNGG